MAFDAGTIIAHLDLDDADFERKLREDVAKVEAFERGEHEIRITPKVDAQSEQETRRSFERLDRQVTEDAKRRGGMFGVLHSIFGRGGSTAGAAGNARGFFSRTLGGIGPGVLGIGARTATIAGAGALGIGALPALLAPAAALGTGALGLGAIALSAKTLIGTKQAQGPLYAQGQAAGKALQEGLLDGAKTMLGPLRTALGEIPKLMKQIQPDLRAFFSGAATLIQPFLHGLVDIAHDVLPGLGQAFRAAAPLIRPLLDGIGQLVRGFLPGLVTLLRASMPAIRVFSQILGTLGRDLGQMFTLMAPVLRQSAVLLKAIFDVVGSLLPIIARLAGMFARALAPVIGAFAGALKALEPALIIIGKMIAGLAGAVLRDLSDALVALAKLLAAIAPSLDIVAKVFTQLVTTLESSGVFATIGSAFEAIAKPLGQLINALVRGLVPILPPLIKFLAQVSAILVSGVAKAVEALMPSLVRLVRDALGLLAKILPPLLPPLTRFAGLFTQTLVDTIVKLVPPLPTLADSILAQLAVLLPPLLPVLIQFFGLFTGVAAGIIEGIASGLNAIMTAIPPNVLASIVIALTALVGLIKLWGVFQAILDIALDANPIGLFALGVAALIGIVLLLWTHWKTVWNGIKTVAEAAWNFLTHGWGQWLVPGLTLIRLAVGFVRDHWKQAWDDIKQAGLDAWHFIHDDIFAPLVNFVTKDIPGAFHDAVTFIGQKWDDIKRIVWTPVNWVVNNVLDGLISAFDWIVSKIGLGSIKIAPFHIAGLAKGGRLPGWGGGDRWPALLESGETVVSKEHSSVLADIFAAVGVPGYQQGGVVRPDQPHFGQQRATHNVGSPIAGFFHKAADIGKITAALFSGNTQALSNAVMDLVGAKGAGGATAGMARLLGGMTNTVLKDIVHWLIGQAGAGSSNAIVRYAESFIGKVPYVWGGTTPQGWDCSGFVEWVYRHFGYQPPRTADEQFGWAQHTARPVPGGLAFFAGADGTQGMPGHAGIVVGPNRMVDAFGTGFGTRFDSIIGSSGAISGFGVPPGGFRAPGTGLASGTWTLGGLERLWESAGGPASAAHIAAAIALAESGGNPRARNPSGASGLFQILGQVFPGNIFNPFINARNAVRKYFQAGGFSPWVTYLTGAYRQFMDNGGWMLPGGAYANATGRPEAVLNPQQSAAFVKFAEAAHEMSRGGGAGRGGLGGFRDLYVMLPEGSTVAQALNEVTWQLQASRQQTFTGVT